VEMVPSAGGSRFSFLKARRATMEAYTMAQGLQTQYREQGLSAVLASKPVRVAGCVLGIVGSLILYGLLQERIMCVVATPVSPCSHIQSHPRLTPRGGCEIRSTANDGTTRPPPQCCNQTDMDITHVRGRGPGAFRVSVRAPVAGLGLEHAPMRRAVVRSSGASDGNGKGAAACRVSPREALREARACTCEDRYAVRRTDSSPALYDSTRPVFPRSSSRVPWRCM
jgi:hypothetical protein